MQDPENESVLLRIDPPASQRRRGGYPGFVVVTATRQYVD